MACGLQPSSPYCHAGPAMTPRLSLLCLFLALSGGGCERRVGEASFVIAPATPADLRRDAVADATITAAVRTALRTVPRLAVLPLQISTRDGVVMLEGRVDNVLLAQHAGVLAADVHGVVDVDNRLAALSGNP